MSEVILDEMIELLKGQISDIDFVHQFENTQASRFFDRPIAVLSVLEEDYQSDNHLVLEIALYVSVTKGAKAGGEIFSQICSVLKNSVHEITAITRGKIKEDDDINSIILPCTLSIDLLNKTILVDGKKVKAKAVSVTRQARQEIRPIGSAKSILISKPKYIIKIVAPSPNLFDDEAIFDFSYNNFSFTNCRVLSSAFDESGHCKELEIEGVHI